MILRPRSLRLRLTLWHAGTLAVILAALGTGVYAVVRESLLSAVGDRAERELAAVKGMLEEHPEDAAEAEEHGMATLFAVADGDAIVHVSEGWRRLGLPAPSQLGAVTAASGVWKWRSATGDRVRGRTAIVDAGERRLMVAAGANEREARSSLASLATILLLAAPVALGLAIVGGWLLAGRMLRPVAAMADAASRISTERLADRLPVEKADDEFGRLATAFNMTLARLEDGFERLRRFTADASHELRTPLTAIRSVGEVALRTDEIPGPAREAIGSMLEEVDRLTRLVEALLVLTRADSSGSPLSPEPLDLAALAREVVESLRVLAEEKDQSLAALADGPVWISGERMTLRQAITNLLDNAIKHSPRGGSVRVTARRTGDSAVLEVVDSGPGIAPEHHARIFDRFHRVERDRGRTSGGAGLGLAIARWAVARNGGTVAVDSTPPDGATFRITLPAHPPANAIGDTA